MTEVHKIKKIVYDVSLDSEELAYDFQSRVNSFVEYGLMPVINEVFDKLDRKQQIVTIDKLELNLGVVDNIDNEELVKDRLRDELTKVLSEKLASINHEPTALEKFMTKEKSGYEHLIYFLEKGSLPWNNRYETYTSIEKILLQAIKNNQKDFVRWIRNAGKNSNIRHRIINQFKDPQIIDIVKSFDATNAPFIANYSSDIRQAHKKEPVVVVPETEFRLITWDVILTYLLSDRGSRFNRKSFIAYTIRQIAIRQNVEYGDLLQEFSRTISRLMKKMAFKSEFPSILTELAGEYEPSVSDTQSANDKKEKEKMQAITTLQKAFLGELKLLDFRILKKLAKEYPKELIDFLLHHIASETIRKEMVEVFSEGQVKWVIQILEPIESPFIFHFADKLDTSNENHKIDQSSKSYKKVKWQIILTALYEERGSNFNRKEFIKSTLSQLASHYNISHKDLVFSLHATLAQLPLKPVELGILNEVLTELKDDLHTDDQIRILPDDDIPQYFDAHDLYDALLFYLNHGYTNVDIYLKYGTEDVSILLERLFKTAPGLASLFIEKAKSPKGLELVINKCSQDFILAVVELILQIHNSATADDAGNLAKAIKEHSFLVIDHSAFYAAILKLVVDGSVIDLTKLTSEINRSWDETIRHKPNQPFNLLAIKSHLINLLKEESYSTMIGKRYDETWEYLFIHYKRDLTSILRDLIVQPGLWTSFIKKTPDHLLIAILKNTTLPEFTIRFVHCFSISYGLRKQQQLLANRVIFWQLVISILLNQETNHTDSIEAAILTQILLRLDDRTSKEKAVMALLSSLSSFSSFEKKKAINIIYGVRRKIRKDQLDTAIQKTDFQRFEASALLLLNGKMVSDVPLLRLIEVLDLLMNERPVKLSEILRRNLYKNEIRQFWIAKLPESLLRRIFFLLFPKGFMVVQSAAEIIWKASGVSLREFNLSVIQTNKWQYLFNALVNIKSTDSPENFISTFIRQILTEVPKYSEKAFMDRLCQELEVDIRPSQKEIYFGIINQVKKLGQNLKTGEITKVAIPHQDTKAQEAAQEEETGETIYISNAGMVLAAPYLPELFKRVNLTENGEFKNRLAAERAIHLLQYMVNGNTSQPEFMLLLNKILCGIKTGIPIQRGIEVTQEEKATIQQLLEGIIMNWKAVSNSSVKGFQESFLQRNGVLKQNDEGQWQLRVESKTFDMLLDQIPWSFSTIRYPWMNNVLYVQWR